MANQWPANHNVVCNGVKQAEVEGKRNGRRHWKNQIMTSNVILI